MRDIGIQRESRQGGMRSAGAKGGWGQTGAGAGDWTTKLGFVMGMRLSNKHRGARRAMSLQHRGALPTFAASRRSASNES
jgi:hypothetical protein